MANLVLKGTVLENSCNKIMLISKCNTYLFQTVVGASKCDEFKLTLYRSTDSKYLVGIFCP